MEVDLPKGRGGYKPFESGQHVEFTGVVVAHDGGAITERERNIAARTDVLNSDMGKVVHHGFTGSLAFVQSALRAATPGTM